MITLEGTVPITVIGCYAPAAGKAETAGMVRDALKKYVPKAPERTCQASLYPSFIRSSLRPRDRVIKITVNEQLMDNHQQELSHELAARQHLVATSPAGLLEALRAMPDKARKLGIPVWRFGG